MTEPIVISLDGNIGAGKSTLLAALRAAMPDVEFVEEPVGAWMTRLGWHAASPGAPHGPDRKAGA